MVVCDHSALLYHFALWVDYIPIVCVYTFAHAQDAVISKILQNIMAKIATSCSFSKRCHCFNHNDGGVLNVC